MALEWGVTPVHDPGGRRRRGAVGDLARGRARDRHRRARRPGRAHRRHRGQHPRLDERDQGRRGVRPGEELPGASGGTCRSWPGEPAPSSAPRSGASARPEAARAARRGRPCSCAGACSGSSALVAFLYYQPVSSYVETRAALARARDRGASAARREERGSSSGWPTSATVAALAREARRMELVRPGERLFIVKGVREWRRASLQRSGYDRTGWMIARSSSGSSAGGRGRSSASPRAARSGRPR